MPDPASSHPVDTGRCDAVFAFQHDTVTALNLAFHVIRSIDDIREVSAFHQGIPPLPQDPS